MTVGSNIQEIYAPMDGKPVNWHVYGWHTEYENTAFDKTDYFAEKNKNNLAKITICDIDLTKVDPSEGVYLRLIVRVAQDNPKMRVLENGVEIPNQLGQTQWMYKGIAELEGAMDKDLYFRLTSGQHNKVEIDYAVPGSPSGTTWGIQLLEVIKIGKKPRFGILPLLCPKQIAGSQSKKVNVKLPILNMSSEKDMDFQVKFFVNNQLRKVVPVKGLAPMVRRNVETTLDLSTMQPLGERFQIRAEAIYSGDKGMPAQVTKREVVNLGTVVRMATMPPNGGDPKQEIVVDEPILFTDDGGEIENYSVARGISAYVHTKFRPKHPGEKVQITFKNAELTGGAAGLYIYSWNTGWDTDRIATPYSIVDRIHEPLTVTSQAADGSLMLYFTSAKNAPCAAGWVAEVSTVSGRNPLQMLSVNKEPMQGAGENVYFPLTVSFENKWDAPLTPVLIRALTDKGAVVFEEQITDPALLAKGKHTYKTKMGITGLQPGVVGNYTVSLFCDSDTDDSDNSASCSIAYDRLTIPHAPKASGNNYRLVKVNTLGKTVELKTASPYHFTHEPFSFYQGDGPQDIKFDAKFPNMKAKLILFLEDATAGKLVRNKTAILQKNYSYDEGSSAHYSFDPTNLAPGDYRLRAVITSENQAEDDPMMADGYDGNAYDFTLRVLADKRPVDIALVELTAGVRGIELTGNAARPEVKLIIRNDSKEIFNGEVEMTVSGDGRGSTSAPIKALVTDLQPGKSVVLPTGIHADFSAQKTYTLSASITVKNDASTDNNQLTRTFTNLPKRDDQIFVAAFSRDPKKACKVTFPDFQAWVPDYHTKHGKCTVEFWLYLDGEQSATVFKSAELTVLVNGTRDPQFPRNSLVVKSGDYTLYTDENTFLPNQWNHVRLQFSDLFPALTNNGQTLYGECRLRCYINGTTVYTNKMGPEDGFHNMIMNLTLGEDLEGAIKGLSFWKSDKWDISFQAYDLLKSSEPDILFDQSMRAGYGSRFLYDLKGNWNGTIHADPAIINATDNTGVWRAVPNLIESFKFAGQSMINGKPAFREEAGSKPGERIYTILFDQEPAGKITGTLYATWLADYYAKYEVKYNAASVISTADRRSFIGEDLFDFASDIVVDVEAKLFGKWRAEKITFKKEVAKSGKALLKTLKLAKNANSSLKQDIDVAVKDEMYIDLSTTTGFLEDPTKVKLDFTYVGKTIAYKGKTLVSGDTEVDLSKLVRIVVTAENGQRKGYNLSLRVAPELMLSVDKTSYKYGDKPTGINVTSTSVASPIFVSSQAEVASIAGGMLQIGIPRSAQIYALSPAKGIYSSAKSKPITITVGRASASVQLRVQDFKAGKPLVTMLKTEGLVAPEDKNYLPGAKISAAYSLLKDGKPVTDTRHLHPGKYLLKPNVPTVESDRYTLTLKESSFRVLPSENLQLTLRIVDRDAAPLQAQVLFRGRVFTADSKGMIVFSNIKKGSHELTISMDGFQAQTIRPVMQDKSLVETVTLQPIAHTITYIAESNGTVNGSDKHLVKVADGAQGEQVLAQGNEGYEFVEWKEDHSDKALRQEQNIKASAQYTATFKAQEFTLTYKATTGGKITGSTPQTVAYNGTGTEVTAEPVTGYYFVEWSDGEKEPKRKEEHVKGNVSLVAIFESYIALPYQSDFSAGQPKRWTFTSENGDWSSSLYNGYPTLGILNPANGKKAYAEVILTPILIPAEARTHGVKVAFDYLSQTDWLPSGIDMRVEYQLDGEGWNNNATQEGVKGEIIKPSRPRLKLVKSGRPASYSRFASCGQDRILLPCDWGILASLCRCQVSRLQFPIPAPGIRMQASMWVLSRRSL